MIRVLFVCVHNAARSQMAEGLANSVFKERINAWSAGSTPTQVHPLAIKAMAEIGVDISGQASKSFSDVAALPFDYVIILCDEGALTCPVFPGRAEQLHWPLPDPVAAKGSEEERLTAFREIRDTLQIKIQSLVADKEAL